MNIRKAIDGKLTILEQEAEEKEIIKAVFKQILAGHSTLKKVLQDNVVEPADVVTAIRNKRCLRTPEQDLGTTYLEQIIGTAIRDIFPLRDINRIRKIFGLGKLPPGELVKKKKEAVAAAAETIPTRKKAKSLPPA
jgi:hypothetical protein